MFTSSRCGLCFPTRIQAATSIAQAVAGTDSPFNNAANGRSHSVPCIFMAQEFPVAIHFKKNRLPADNSRPTLTKLKTKGGKP